MRNPRQFEPRYLSPPIVRVARQRSLSAGGDGTFEPGQDCAFFSSTTTPKTVFVDIAGAQNDTCTDCEVVWDQQFELEQTIASACIWENEVGVTGSCASFTRLQFAITQQIFGFPPNQIIYRRFSLTAFRNGISFDQWQVEQVFANEPAPSIDGRTLDVTLQNLGVSTDSQCDLSGSVARVRS